MNESGIHTSATNTKDWTGNTHSVVKQAGSSNGAKEAREAQDYYATEPKAIDELCKCETFSPIVWECACGEGHMSEALSRHGYHVISTDLIERGYGQGGVDFLNLPVSRGDVDIITNPPYKYALDFIKRALETLEDGRKLALLLPIQFLEGKARRKLYDEQPPKVIYVSSGRLVCAKNADWERYAKCSLRCYAWFVWVKGWRGETTLRWMN